MNNKKWLVLVVPIVMLAALWFTGIIPKQIARIAGTSYVEKHFPEMQLECVGVEYAEAFGDYLISFKDKNGNAYSCVIGPELFPVSLGQGLFAIECDYAEYKLIYGAVPDAERSEQAINGRGGPLILAE
ncbi:MAG: hypothetical protein E7464_02045 [Ruminococcaceae bacterium]|nr:hypothetical protein [Oscillospiraceae bacterium]